MTLLTAPIDIMLILLRVDMMRIFIILFFTAFCHAAFGSKQNEESIKKEVAEDDPYYTEDEGRLLFKFRVHGILAQSVQKDLPNALSTTPLSVPKIFHYGIGFDTSTGIFFNDNIAAEISLGLLGLKVNKDHLQSIANNYNGTGFNKKTNNVYVIPISLLGQFHILPFSDIRPYVGAGYHFGYVIARAKNYTMSHLHGPVLQAGMDFIAKDNTIITFDVRQFFNTAKIKYQSELSSIPNMTSKIKMNPLVISLGFGLKM